MSEACPIADEVYGLIATGKATRAAELVVRVLNERSHVAAHRQHLADVRDRRRIAGRVPSLRQPEETASRIVDQALQRLRRDGLIRYTRKGWRLA